MSISAQYFCLVLYFFCLMFSWSACWTMFYLGFASKAHPPLLTENLPPSCQDVRVLGRACTHSIGQACKKKRTTKPRTALILQQITVSYGKNDTLDENTLTARTISDRLAKLSQPRLKSKLTQNYTNLTITINAQA